jgi:hypothetical protein
LNLGVTWITDLHSSLLPKIVSYMLLANFLTPPPTPLFCGIISAHVNLLSLSLDPLDHIREGQDGTETSNGDVLICPDMIRYRSITFSFWYSFVQNFFLPANLVLDLVE